MSNEKLEVPSPTFSLVQEYELSEDCIIYHCDLYRLVDPLEVIQLDLGITHKKHNNIYLVEWAEKAAGCLIEPDITIEFNVENNTNIRVITIKAATELLEKVGSYFESKN